MIALECSSAQPYAPIGGGAIIRVGDRTSVFNSALTYFVNATAEELAGIDKKLKFQRALMPGGSCEGTVYDLYGFTVACLCVPLGNYHNMDRDRKTIGPEYVNLDDWVSMTRLLVELARRGDEFDAANPLLKDRLEKRFAEWASLLRK